jgi:hypothetical protein
VRLALSDVVTGEELREQLDRLVDAVGRIAVRLDELETRAGSTAAADG